MLSWTAAGGGASGNSFETIDVPAGTDPVADSSTDTLTLTSTNSTATITGTASTDTIDLSVIDLACTDCIGTTEIADSYVLNAGDTMTGDLAFSMSGADISATDTAAGSETWGLHFDPEQFFIRNNKAGGPVGFSINAVDDSVHIGEIGFEPTKVIVYTDGTGNDEVRLPTDSIGVSELDTADDPANAEVLAYQSSTGRMVWSPDAGAAGGDSITVNASAATDPDFLNLSSGISWTLTGGNSITAALAEDPVISGISPSIQLNPTSGNPIHFGAEVAGANTVAFLSNTTSGQHYLRAYGTTLELPTLSGTANCDVKAKLGGQLYCGADATGTDIGARVNETAAQSISNNTLTVVTFSVERWDTDTIHSTVSNTGRLTATTAGKYVICGNLSMAANATGVRDMIIQLNGVTQIMESRLTNLANSAQYLEGCTLYNLAATNYVEMLIYQNSGGALNTSIDANNVPEFSMQKVN